MERRPPGPFKDAQYGFLLSCLPRMNEWTDWALFDRSLLEMNASVTAFGLAGRAAGLVSPLNLTEGLADVDVEGFF
jgi:hypothetical protein